MCTGMTLARTTVDSEWEKFINAATNVNFNFYTELKKMVATVKSRLLGPNFGLGGPPINIWNCAIQFMGQKLRAYWDPINECYVSSTLQDTNT